MASPVAALYTSITLEHSQFVTNAKRAATAAEKMSNDISRSLTVAKSAVQGFIAAAAVGFATTGIRNALNYASAIGETAQQLGVATDAYQELTYAATQSGVAQQELETGLSRLTRNIGQGAKVFGELGISIKDAAGNSRETGEVFKDIAGKLGKISDPAKRAAYEVALFGKTGQKLDTLLAGGTAALSSLANEARRLGLVLNKDQIRDADNAADAWGRVATTLNVNIASTVSQNAKALESLAGAAGSLIQSVGGGATMFRKFLQDVQIFNGEVAAKLPWTSDAVKKGNADYKANVQFERFGSLTPWANASFASKPPPAGGLADVPAKVDAITKSTTAATKAAYDFAGALDAMHKESVSFAGDGGPLSVFATDDAIYAQTVSKFTELGDMSKLVQPIELIDEKQLANVQKFGESLSSNLGTALVYGQNLGDALVNSLKAAAAEAISSGLFKLLTGGGTGGGIIGGIIGSVSGLFGGFREGGGSVSANKAYVVGERGPELLTGASGRIIPNGAIGSMGGMSGGLVVNVDARGAGDPAAVRVAALSAVAEAAPALLAAARGETIGKLRRPTIAGGRR